MTNSFTIKIIIIFFEDVFINVSLGRVVEYNWGSTTLAYLYCHVAPSNMVVGA